MLSPSKFFAKPVLALTACSCIGMPVILTSDTVRFSTVSVAPPPASLVCVPPPLARVVVTVPPPPFAPLLSARKADSVTFSMMALI